MSERAERERGNKKLWGARGTSAGTGGPPVEPGEKRVVYIRRGAQKRRKKEHKERERESKKRPFGPEEPAKRERERDTCLKIV